MLANAYGRNENCIPKVVGTGGSACKPGTCNSMQLRLQASKCARGSGTWKVDVDRYK